MAEKLDLDSFQSCVQDVLNSPLSDRSDGTRANLSQRERAIERLLRLLQQHGTLDVWANSLSNSYGLRGAIREDVLSVVTEKVFVTLLLATPEKHSAVGSWIEFLFALSKNSIRDYLSSGEVTVAAGMTGATRRQSSIHAARRDLLAKHGREPSQAEIIQHVNEYMVANRKNPTRDGVFVTAEDFSANHLPARNTDEVIGMSSNRGTAEDIEQNAETVLATRSLFRTCERMFSTELGVLTVARALVLSEAERPKRSEAEIARLIGTTPQRLRAGFQKILGDPQLNALLKNALTANDRNRRAAQVRLWNGIVAKYPNELGLLSVARVWTELTFQGEPPTLTAIVEITGIPRGQVRKQLANLKNALEYLQSN